MNTFLGMNNSPRRSAHELKAQKPVDWGGYPEISFFAVIAASSHFLSTMR